jgi:(p)ppGpp synthase/HD superfamily hydrolase
MASLDDAYHELQTANAHLADIENLVAFGLQQNVTIICNLEKISKQTCELVNQSVRQTAAQESMAATLGGMKQLYELANPEAAVEQGRLEGLRHQIEECCPPAQPEPVCTYEPCKDPGRPPKGGK